MSTCCSLGKAALLHPTAALPNAGSHLEGLQSVPAPRVQPGHSKTSLVTVYPPFYLQPVMWQGAVLGKQGQEEEEEEEEGGSPGRCRLQLTAAPSSFPSPDFSKGSSSTRNFSPSGWQPQQVPAWGGPAAMKEAERQKDMGSSSWLPLHPPFPELIHRCYYSGKKWSALANSKVSSLPQLLCGLLC